MLCQQPAVECLGVRWREEVDDGANRLQQGFGCSLGFKFARKPFEVGRTLVSDERTNE